MLSPADKQKAIEHIVHNVFVPEHNRALALFLVQYTEQVRKSTELSLAIGIPVSMPPTHLDLRQPIEQLVNNLLSFEILYKDPPLQ